jgi:hypothetical protein
VRAPIVGTGGEESHLLRRHIAGHVMTLSD